MSVIGGGGNGRGSAPKLVFNGILNRKLDSGYLHEPRTPEDFLDDLGDAPLLPPPATYALAQHLDPDDLGQAGWAVIWGAGLDPRIKLKMKPLLELRRAQAGSLFQEIEFRTGETYLQFLIRQGAAVGQVNPMRLPYYLLLVGGPVEIPFEFQYQMDVSHAVGRLSFSSPEEYGHYARNVVKVERNGSREQRSRSLAVFGVRNEDDPNTDSCHKFMAQPLSSLLARDVPSWSVADWLSADATKARLETLLAGDSTPALLLTCSHGLMFESDDPFQPTDQGAILCADWPGPKLWKARIPPEQYFAARDVRPDSDLTGMILFQFACFSAGTPTHDSYSQAKGGAVPRLAQTDMIAPLAQRLLGKPGGTALAVVGHVDQVWEASYLWPGAGQQLETFESCFRCLMAGKRLGLALEPFGQKHATIATYLTDQLELWRRNPKSRHRGISDALGEAFLWLAHNDARGYVLLGDPAVRPSARAADAST